jgi:hypothetical protein
MAHIVSTTQPPNGALGDEWFNPASNKIYKLVVYNGVSVGWQEQLTANSVATVLATNTFNYDPSIDPFLLSGM